jgi:hypothetical protein
LLKMVANKAADENKPEAYFQKYVEDLRRVENEVGGHFQQPLFRHRDELPYPCPEAAGISALDIDDTGTAKPAHKSFS